ncbi:MAG: hypothetical protein HS111_10125 [Kofleriaceae bacterium]|nr:hypothetical protein [Kofleriaceae bacterium]
MSGFTSPERLDMPASPAAASSAQPGSSVSPRSGGGATTRRLPARPTHELPPEADAETKRASAERSAEAARDQHQIDEGVFGWGTGTHRKVQRKAVRAAHRSPKHVDLAASLPPFVRSVLLDGDVGEVAELVKTLRGDSLKAWLDYLREKRGVAFVDEVRRRLDRPPTYAPSDAACDLGEPEARDDACSLDAPHSPDAIAGVSLYLVSQDKIRGLATRVLDHQQVGPGNAGPYKLYAHTKDDRLVYYMAHHTKRRQHEWIIGPESIEGFAASAAMYASTAARLLPGSANVAGSQADGADAVRDPDSVVKQEGDGRAPWQVAQPAVELLNGGGSMLNGARNARLRMTEYVKPAERLAQQLADDVAAGKVDHLDARAQAVEGRNELLQKTRRRQSPAARYASGKLKDERGRSVAEMTAKKVKDNLNAYGVSDETRRLLDTDSDLWGKYAAAMNAGDDVMAAALHDLGQSPEVSRSIIRSAGKTNKWVTRAARFGGPVALALGAVGAADMVMDIKDAIEADNLHAAAREFAGFAGGVVGGELGAMGAVWLASAIFPGAGTGVIIVASLVGGSAMGTLVAHGAESLVDALAEGTAPAGFATPLAAGGGFAGIHGKDGPRSAAKQIADTIFAADGELAKLAVVIPRARTRAELSALQRKRLETLARRQELDDLLTAVKLGAFDGKDECPVPPPEPPPPAPAPPSECDIDNDCDTEVW